MEREKKKILKSKCIAIIEEDKKVGSGDIELSEEEILYKLYIYTR